MLHDRRIALVLVLASQILGIEAPALADTDEAREALRKGYELKKAGRCAEAVVFLRESFEKRPTAKAVLNLAECEESSGKFLTARGHYEQGKRLSSSERNAELTALADARVSAIRSRIPRVTFVLPRGGELYLDGARLAGLSDVEVDPGDHVARIVLPGFEARSAALTLAPGERRSVTLEPGPAIQADPGLQGRASAPGAGQAEGGSPGSARRVAGGVIFGAGVLGVAVGSVLALTAKGDYDSAVSSHCDPSGCDPEGLAGVSGARGRADGATVLFVAGGVATATGLVLFFTAPRASVRAGASGAGLFVRGAF